MSVDRNSVTIVTGAAGGMGRAVARAFAAQGRPLILCDLKRESLEEMVRTLDSTAAIEIVHGDISGQDFPAKIISALGGRRIAALAHTAGLSPSMAAGPRIFAVNFIATKQLTETVLPHMAGGGVVVLIASNSGQMLAYSIIDRAIRKVLKGRRSLLVSLLLRQSRSSYPLSKRAVQLYTQSMAPAFGAVGARIVSLSPGIIDTGMGRLEQQAGPEMDRMIALTPLARMGGPEEIASVGAFLASPAAGYISGTDILVDGGTIAGIAAAGGVMALVRAS
jgi:NAD(P)-dependent dehydrogenase (short-subunit alcohol dehydrogenase family)